VRKVLGSGEYRVKINTTELDAAQLAKDIHLKENYHCSYCGSDLILVLSVSDISTHEFKTKIICPNCGRA
jgi:DNA-directed RNA polymerase subunit RPC12/RpoP